MLGEIGTFVRGRRFTKADMVEEGIPCIHYGEIYTQYGASARTTVSHVREDLRDQLRYAQSGDVIVAGVGETVEDVGKAVAWLGEGEVAFHDDSFLFRSELDPTYVSYYFQTSTFRAEKEQYVSRAKMKRLSSSGLSRVTIPVPPPEVQREIVRILDKATELRADLRAELRAELQARTRQYQYYRDGILTFTEGASVRRARLRELLKEPLANGRSVPDGFGYPVLRLTALHGSVVDVSQHKLGSWDDATGRRFRIEAGDLLIVRGNGSKDLIARACMVERTEEIAFPDTMIRVRPDLDQVSQRYLFYIWECSATRVQLQRSAKLTSGVWKVSQDDLSEIILPVPPLEEQERIVSILDKFDEMVTGLSADLSAEIEARRKQYEHYRDKLLTFEERVA
ncbi:Type I restriction-modification system, specificity subunit S [Actinosynnema pretiosum subsp. pretiosum]|nr:Type I restriction-modification system, specificity subunit S [Actinosynnema pretiosum subsp. pretiosum]